jgi:lipoprotein-anchoring transpeptidase ErfK/SrfK/peptidoglycan hydrolase-like protein with peptidoglycan-binding domain
MRLKQQIRHWRRYVRICAPQPWQALLAFVIAICASLAAGLWGQQPRTSPSTRPQHAATTSSALSPSTASTGSKTTGAKPARLQASQIDDPNNRRPVGPHSEGNAVVRAAILLDRLKFSPGEIGKSYGNNLAKAIQAFQSASGLPATGNVDPATWAALTSDQSPGPVAQKQSEPQPNAGDSKAQAPPGTSLNTGSGTNRDTNPDANAPPAPSGKPQQAAPASDVSQTRALTTYIITPEDVAGPFTHFPRVTGHDAGERLMLLESKLARLNYESPLQLLAEKFHASPSLLVELNPGKRFDKAGGKIAVPNVLTPDPAAAASVVVDGSNRSVTALDVGGKILAFYPATVGSEHDPLPVGNWTIDEVTWYPKFKYNPNLFWDADNKSPRATLPPGPKNPVGVVWIGLSKKHYGIHGTPEPSRIGVTQSHGCIRLTNWDAAELGKMVRVGIAAVLKNGEPPNAGGKTSRNATRPPAAATAGVPSGTPPAGSATSHGAN